MSSPKSRFEDSLTLEGLREKIEHFADDRDWHKEHLGEELSDVLIYLVRLADRCNIDLATAALRKMDKNAIKYPANLVRVLFTIKR
ncbi:hypothetical protein DYB26_002740, partial [Aphanomyces astaci]